MNRGETWIADRLPKHLADIAAVNGIGETSLLKQRIDEFVEPRGELDALVRYLAVGNFMEKSVGTALIQFTKGLAIAFPAGRIRGSEARLEILFGCERQLITQFRLTFSPGAAHIEARALTETACQLSVDVDCKPTIDGAGCQRIRRAHHVDHYLDEAG